MTKSIAITTYMRVTLCADDPCFLHRSHTALDKKGKGASGKGNKKQDKMEKPGTKDGRKSDMGNKGKDDKRKGRFFRVFQCILHLSRALQ